MYGFQTFELPSFLNAQRMGIVWHSPFRSGKSEMEANRTGAGSMGFGGKEWSIDEKPFEIDQIMILTTENGLSDDFWSV